MKRIASLAGLVITLLLATAPADAQAEQIHRFAITIAIQPDDSLKITETIAYDFGAAERHGIVRDLPTTLRFDDTYDRIYPLEVDSVQASGGASAAYTTEDIGEGLTRIKIGDADHTVTGQHIYTITYTVGSAMNGFAEHDELYWNAVGTRWPVTIDEATVSVSAPAAITDVACFQGPAGSSASCDRAKAKGPLASFAQAQLFPFSGMTVVVSLPKGTVADPAPDLRERWSLASAFRLTPRTGFGAGGLLVLVLGGLIALVWTKGRDRRFRGSQIDEVMGNPTGEDEAVAPFQAGRSAPVEFAPPEGVHPGQVGTLVDEVANALDVTATIVDLAVRGFLLIQEVPKEGWFGKPDWTLIRLEKDGAELLTYERRLLDGLFRDGTDVTLSSLRTTFHERLEGVQESLYADAVKRGWFATRPDKVRARWSGRGMVLLLLGGVITVALARWTHWALMGLPIVLGGIAMMAVASRMPARTAKGTAMLRRVRGFRTVIEKAEANLARWAEQENVFTIYLPYAVVFGCTEKWAKAFEGLAIQPDTSWYVSNRPFVITDFARSVDGFSVATGGSIASTPAGSGSSGFSGGFSGGGGGGGGGGSW